ncbi:MAG: ParD-like family protein, partial [Gammaproteobacteria bacterium]|nr:ParD-like family protein [Gammaproteobacteria bacterium]
MSSAVKVSDELISKARTYAKIFHRSTAGQIEHGAKTGQILEENPGVSYQFAQDILVAMEELKSS